MSLFGYEALFAWLQQAGLGDWAGQLQRQTDAALDPQGHGDLPRWLGALALLPALQGQADCNRDAVTVTGSVPESAGRRLHRALRELHPWRKGPFHLFGTDIDTEWRSCLKWDRLAAACNFRGEKVLDIGAGNGYYGWRMLGQGADFVMGVDPTLLFVMQYAAIRKYLPELPNYVLPLGVEQLPATLPFFDSVLSMGVLYHRRAPLDHLAHLRALARPGGRVVVETLVVDGGVDTVLVPEGRYAKMRNVWMIPSVEMLQRWMRRTGLREVKVLDVSVTTDAEQRSTEWMTFESLPDFLAPDGSGRTIEGYPQPMRAIVTGMVS